MDTISKIRMIAPYTEDRILSKNGRSSIKIGGSAHYCSVVFQREGIPYVLQELPKLHFDITQSQEGDFIKCTSNPKKLEFDFKTITESVLFLSPLAEEISLRTLKGYTGKVFIDLQGFCRHEKDYLDYLWHNFREDCLSVFCIKGTENEISLVPPDLINVQKNKVLISTLGKSGSLAYINGQKYKFSLSTVTEVDDTTGAGDIFYALLLSEWVRSGDIFKSVDYATNNVGKFLIDKE